MDAGNSRVFNLVTTDPQELRRLAARATDLAQQLQAAAETLTAGAEYFEVLQGGRGGSATLAISDERWARSVIRLVALHCRLDYESVIGYRRHQALLIARQLAMLLIRERTELSYPRIGQLFGGRDHTTVMNAVGRARKQLQVDLGFAQRYRAIGVIIDSGAFPDVLGDDA